MVGIHKRDSEDRRKICYSVKPFSVAIEFLPVLLSHHHRLLIDIKEANGDVPTVVNALSNFTNAKW